MRNEIPTLTTPLLVLMILLVLFVPPARAFAQSFGNDDQEFDVGSSLSPTYVGLNETFYLPMAWSSSPPDNLVSMQYNPDILTSELLQYGQDWFQTGIASDVNGCGSFSIQVYNIITTVLVFRADQGFSNCSQGYLGQGATWTILEEGFYTEAGETRVIADVFFSISSANGASFSYTLYPSQFWKWFRSNLCWCGTNSGFTTFTNAYGLSAVYSDADVNSIAPPVLIGTNENSNMAYSNFYDSATQIMRQEFGWCMCAGGGGGLCGSKTAGYCAT
jgi:hypothetical protein